jgi:hypothetical protein
MVETSMYGSERARAGDRPGYSSHTKRWKIRSIELAGRGWRLLDNEAESPVIAE